MTRQLEFGWHSFGCAPDLPMNYSIKETTLGLFVGELDVATQDAAMRLARLTRAVRWNAQARLDSAAMATRDRS